MTLTLLRSCILRSQITMELPQNRPLHLLEELELYTQPGHYLFHCSAEDLEQLSRSIYRLFGTTEAADHALDHDADRATEFFSKHINERCDSLFSVPPAGQPSFSEDEDSGHSFYNAADDATGGDFGDSARARVEATFEEPAVFEKAPDHNEESADILMYNNALLFRDLLFYWEFRTSVHDGDIGRTFEIIKVCCSNLLLIYLSQTCAESHC